MNVSGAQSAKEFSFSFPMNVMSLLSAEQLKRKALIEQIGYDLHPFIWEGSM